MKFIVADASAIVEYLLRTPRGEVVEAAVRDPETELHVPSLCDIEVSSVLRRALLGRQLSKNRALDAIEDYLDMPIARHGHTLLLSRIVALRENFSAYDATYLALADRLEAPLLTGDESLTRAVRSHTDIDVV